MKNEICIFEFKQPFERFDFKRFVNVCINSRVQYTLIKTSTENVSFPSLLLVERCEKKFQRGRNKMHGSVVFAVLLQTLGVIYSSRERECVHTRSTCDRSRHFERARANGAILNFPSLGNIAASSIFATKGRLLFKIFLIETARTILRISEFIFSSLTKKKLSNRKF